MHEMSLAENMLSIIEQQAQAQPQPFRRVHAVVLEIGVLAAVEPEAMRFCFEAVTRGTIAEGAQLKIVEISGQGWCMECAKTVQLAERYGLCPECSGTRVAITGGDRMRVVELDVE
jgi:hydrogenase nickel incorporation protein HypA/HybF